MKIYENVYTPWYYRHYFCQQRRKTSYSFSTCTQEGWFRIEARLLPYRKVTVFCHSHLPPMYGQHVGLWEKLWSFGYEITTKSTVITRLGKGKQSRSPRDLLYRNFAGGAKLSAVWTSCTLTRLSDDWQILVSGNSSAEMTWQWQWAHYVHWWGNSWHRWQKMPPPNYM